MSLSFGKAIITNNLLVQYDPANLFSYPRVGSAITDLSSNGNNASLSNIGFFTTNIGILSFNGSSSYVISQGGFIGVATTAQLTINTWIYINNTSTSCIFNSWVNSATLSTTFGLVQKNGIIYARNSVADYILSGANILPNQWYNVCLTYSSVGATCYINSTPVATSTSAQITYNAGITSFVFGCQGFSTFVEAFNGYMGLLGIYNTNLTPSQITQNFDAMRGRYNV